MPRLLSLLTSGLIAVTATGLQSGKAEAYPVDCAILLCLAGGWPASAECAQARAVFIQRITPWPIEPPLQIWNCPMRASFEGGQRPLDRLLNVALRADLPSQGLSLPEDPATPILVDAQADVDISDPAFDFVRSVRVFEITYQQRRNQEGDCIRRNTVFLGSYGAQGDYTRRRSSPSAVPEASDLAVPASCSTYAHRSVFVEWRDYAGTYGHEEVHY